MPSDGPEMAAYNLAALRVAEEVEEEAQALTSDSLGQRVELLAKLVPPVTQKVHYNALHYTPHYAEAHSAYERVRDLLLKGLPDDALQLLDPEFRHRAWALRCPEQATIWGPCGLRLVREERKDQWYLVLSREDGEHWHPHWVRTGHLSPKALSLGVASYKAPSGERVLSVVVVETRPREGGPAPLATEIIVRGEEVSFSPWRERVINWECALAGPSEPETVHLLKWPVTPGLKAHLQEYWRRLGDLLLLYMGPEDWEQARCPEPEEIPSWTPPVELTEQGQQWKSDLIKGDLLRLTPTGEVLLRNPQGNITLSHPDHYSVVIPGWEFIAIRPIEGRTQYSPRWE